MTNGGYLTQKKTNPVGLGLVVAGHVAVLTAIALAPPEAIQRITYIPTLVENIVDKQPPPPDTLPPTAKVEQQTVPRTVERLVDIGQQTPILLDPMPPIGDTAPTRPEPVAIEPLFIGATIDPAAMARFQPGYPSALARADIEGSATVRVLIGADGRVKTVEMVGATNPGFFEATKEHALRAWRFRPATRDGIAVESWRTMTVRFKLES